MSLLDGYGSRRPPNTVLVLISCPACRGQVVSYATEAIDTQYSFFSARPRDLACWIKCGDCGRLLFARAGMQALLTESPEQLDGRISVYVSFVARFFAVAAVLLAIFPIVGFGVTLIALLANFRSPGWPKVSCRIALGLSLVANALLLIGMLVND
jgi:hypothetical protein